MSIHNYKILIYCRYFNLVLLKSTPFYFIYLCILPYFNACLLVEFCSHFCIYILVICDLNLNRFVCIFSEISYDHRDKFSRWG